MVVLEKLGLTLNKSVGSTRGSIIAFRPSYLGLMMVRYKNLGRKREAVETHKMRCLHVPRVERVILMNDSLQ